jgi:hypothetical protein
LGSVKPKTSAGKPADAAPGNGQSAAATGAAGGSAGGGGGGGGGSSAPEQDISKDVADTKALDGAPTVPDARKSGDAFKSQRDGPFDVPIYEKILPTGKIVMFTSKMAIDVDGAGGAWKSDAPGVGKNETAGHDANGESWNPLKIPYVVIPGNFGHGVKLNDYVAVTYNKKTVFGIVGDIGRDHVVGEASPAVAKPLGINPNPRTGGADKDVTYYFFPGSGGTPPSSADEIQARGRTLANLYHL